MENSRVNKNEKNQVEEIEMMIDYLMNPVYAVSGDFTVGMAVEILKKDADLIIINENDNGKTRIIDKDILLDVLMKDIGKENSIFEYGSDDFCILENMDSISEIQSRFILVQNLDYRVTGVFKRTYLNRLSRQFNHIDEKNMIKIVKNKLKDKTLDIVVNKVVPIRQAKESVERELIKMVMKETRSTYKAARILDVSQSTIARKTKMYNDELLDLIQ